MNKSFIFVLMSVLVTLLSLSQEKGKEANAKMPSGFRGEFLYQLDDVSKKIVDLAEAVPTEKYTWRPMEGVRSISEVYMHIAGANYLLPSFVGFKPPAGMNRDMEKTVTEKANVVKFLKQSFEFIRKAIMETSDSDLDKPAKIFGRETTMRGVFFEIANHMHEHLGQSIAYARMNKIVPPWTAAEQAQQKQNSKK
ncbi:MAG: DinB family protein [Ignavibacteriae bacterium]|nr:DinB family protein [Ignavibacteriota bacterium]